MLKLLTKVRHVALLRDVMNNAILVRHEIGTPSLNSSIAVNCKRIPLKFGTNIFDTNCNKQCKNY